MASNVVGIRVMIQRMRGFTLIELMIVVAIVAILAAIALPAYGRYAFRAHRVDGQELLLRVANAQERYYSTYNRYGTLAQLDYADASSEKKYYTVEVDLVTIGGVDNQGYKATAIPQGGQASDVCGSLSISQSGVKLPAANDDASKINGSCW